jgi:hypothetical protein
MNYFRIYKELILRAKERETVEGYKEIHHIIPRAFSGTDDPSNLVELTAREHFIAHRLLAKIFPNSCMVHVVWYLMNTKNELIGQITSRVYETLKNEHSKRISTILKGRIVSKETCEKLSKIKQEIEKRRKELGIPHPLEGIKRTKETCEKLSKIHKGKVISEEQKKKISDKISGELNGMFGKTHTEEARKKISEGNKQQVECPFCGKIGGIAIMQRWHFDNCKLSPTYVPPKKMKRKSPTEETRKKISEANLGKKSPLKGKKLKADTVCPHCGKIGPASQMRQWHFDNCKHKEKQNE